MRVENRPFLHTKLSSYLLTLLVLVLPAALNGQIVFSHVLSPDKSTIQLVTDGGALVPSYAREAGMSDTVELSFDDQYTFSQLSATPTGWNFNESSLGGTTLRTYFYEGVDGGNPNELFDFSNFFVLDFMLLTPDAVLSPTTVSLGYAFSGISFPGGIPSVQSEGIPNFLDIPGGVRLMSSIPEPSTYAIALGLLALFVVWRRSRSKS